MTDTLLALFETETVVLRARYPGLRAQFDAALRRGAIVAVLAGTYVLAGETDLATRALAACRRYPRAVITGGAAQVLGYQPTATPPSVVAVAGAQGRGAPGYRFTRAVVPEGCFRTLNGIRIADPAWTALDLALEQGPGALDEALRLGVSLDDLDAALRTRAPARGTATLRRYLAESGERPWSPAERTAHLLLRSDGISGWQGNVGLQLPGRRVFLDIAFGGLRLAIEIDGYEHHSSRKAFHDDRLRDLDLEAAGWKVVRVPASVVLEQPDRFLDLVRGVLARRRAELGLD